MITTNNYKEAIEKSLNEVFVPEKVFITQKEYFIYQLEGTSKARNRFDDESGIVKVKNWFDDFWLYISLFFKTDLEKKSKLYPFVSITFFEGKDEDEEKSQLFRAEWDSFKNEEDYHPQPHWHITSNQSLERSFKDIASSSNDQGKTLISILEDEQKIGLNINQIHFAMAGNWYENEKINMEINSPEQLAKWIKNLLKHVRNELEYIK